MTKPREAFRCGCWEFKLRGMGLLVLVGGSYREGWDYVVVKTAMANGGIASVCGNGNQSRIDYYECDVYYWGEIASYSLY